MHYIWKHTICSFHFCHQKRCRAVCVALGHFNISPLTIITNIVYRKCLQLRFTMQGFRKVLESTYHKLATFSFPIWCSPLIMDISYSVACTWDISISTIKRTSNMWIHMYTCLWIHWTLLWSTHLYIYGNQQILLILDMHKQYRHVHHHNNSKLYISSAC